MVIRLLLSLLFFVSPLRAGVVTALDFEGNLTDGSGNGHNGYVTGSGPSYVSAAPKAISGNYYITGLSDTNYASLTPTSFSGISTQGTIEWGSFYAYASVGPDYAALFEAAFHGQRFAVRQHTNTTIDILFPTEGAQGSTGNITAYRNGRPFRTRFSWSGTSWTLHTMDLATEAWTLVTSGTAASNISFNGCTRFDMGTAIVSDAGYAWGGKLDSVVIYDASMGNVSYDAFTYKIPIIFSSFGASITGGDIDGIGYCEGWRLRLQALAEDNGHSWLFAGARNDYCEPTAYSSQTDIRLLSIDTLGIVDNSVRANFLTFTANNAAVIGGDNLINDHVYSVATSTSKANYDAIATSINAVSPLIKMIFTTNMTGEVQLPDVTEVNNIMLECYNTAVSKGYNAFFYDLSKTVTAPTYITYHPDQNTYDQMGAGYYGFLTTTVYQEDTPTYTPTPTVTLTPTPTLTRTPTVGFAGALKVPRP